jgi:RNA polymerase sigma factor (sigma-70 family)
MTKTERRALQTAAMHGSKTARDKLWNEAMRLVLRSEHRLRKLYGIEEQDEDMVQEGALAAGRAVDTWDPERSSFATWVLTNVKGAMLDYLNEYCKHGIGSKSSAVIMVDMEEGVASAPEMTGTTDVPGTAEEDAIPRSELLTYEGVRVGPNVDGNGFVPEGFEDVETRVDYNKLYTAIGQLSPDDAFIIRAYYGIGRARLTLAELCDAVGYSLSGIRKRITLLENSLKSSLQFT